jgi:antitoxin component of MazEF toxin-antitoxin module
MIFDLGQRKIQKVGYPYLIPIPTNWIKNMNVEKGDTLDIKMVEDRSFRIAVRQEGD